MSTKERRRKGVLASASGEKSNSLDWDSPSTKTGTVKRRPNSGPILLKRTTKNWKTGPKDPETLVRNGSSARRNSRTPNQLRKKYSTITKNWISRLRERHPITTMSSLGLKSPNFPKLVPPRYTITTKSLSLRRATVPDPKSTPG
nr:unnamed protein product [Callosobruchus chinensis]